MTTATRSEVARRRRRRLVAALFVAAPLVAEFVSGNLPIIYVWLLVIYAPLYGGAAVLIRELGRRSARPWPVIATFGLAYGVVEESFVSFSLFNPEYADLALLEFGWIPALGIGAWWSVFVVVLHAVWSICVPVVLVESFAGDLADRPWLSRRGMAGAAVAFVLGAAAAVAVTISEDSFLPSGGQLVGATLTVAVLIAVATLLARRPVRSRRSATEPAPSPGAVAIVAALAGLAFVAGAAQAGPVLVTLFGYAVLFAGVAVCISRWSHSDGWDARHRLALATGVLVPHVAFALLQPTLVDVPTWVGVGGDLIFAATLTVFVVIAWSRARPQIVGHGRSRASG